MSLLERLTNYLFSEGHVCMRDSNLDGKIPYGSPLGIRINIHSLGAFSPEHQHTRVELLQNKWTRNCMYSTLCDAMKWLDDTPFTKYIYTGVLFDTTGIIYLIPTGDMKPCEYSHLQFSSSIAAFSAQRFRAHALETRGSFPFSASIFDKFFGSDELSYPTFDVTARFFRLGKTEDDLLDYLDLIEAEKETHLYCLQKEFEEDSSEDDGTNDSDEEETNDTTNDSEEGDEWFLIKRDLTDDSLFGSKVVTDADELFDVLQMPKIKVVPCAPPPPMKKSIKNVNIELKK